MKITSSLNERQLPSLPRRLQRSTLGLWTLNCCVRNGNRWFRSGIITALLTCPRAKPAGHMRLGNKSYGKVSQESSPKDADAWLTLTALSVCPLKTSQKKLPCKLKQILAHLIRSTFALQTSTKWLTQNCSFALAHSVLVRYLSQALDRLVLVSSTHCCAPTPSLSTSSSSRGLTSF